MFHPAVGWSGALALPRWPQADAGRQGGSLLELWVWLRARGGLESEGGEGEWEAAKPEGLQPLPSELGVRHGSLQEASGQAPSWAHRAACTPGLPQDEADGAPCGRDRA